jgi:hypothetical protein
MEVPPVRVTATIALGSFPSVLPPPRTIPDDPCFLCGGIGIMNIMLANVRSRIRVEMCFRQRNHGPAAHPR